MHTHTRAKHLHVIRHTQHSHLTPTYTHRTRNVATLSRMTIPDAPHLEPGLLRPFAYQQ
ncbi:hypothetical protein BDV97DRAFT_341527 [Delphinella strobiligena]|nr:hypothetical protein BDV97DRAFT_341527 [Delphinella strobiligena]